MYAYSTNVLTRPSRRYAPRLRTLALLVLPTLLVAPLARAQEHRNEFGVWGAYSARTQNIQGSVTDFDFVVASFRYARLLHASPSLGIEYTVDVEPLELSRQNTWVGCIVNSGGTFVSGYCPSGRETVYGGGLSPIGWKFNFMRTRRWQPVLASTGGFVASRRPIPKDIPLATQFNFTFDFQAGVERFNRSGTRAWTFIAKIQHISNASRSNVNPGANMIMLSAGYSFLK